jgi:hypothetical protein
LRHARNFSLKDVEIRWEKPEATTWKTGLAVDNVQDLVLDGVDIAQAPGSSAPVLSLKNVENVTLRHSRAATLHVAGAQSRKIRLVDTEASVSTDPDVAKGAVVK